jgi:hypothetical protein
MPHAVRQGMRGKLSPNLHGLASAVGHATLGSASLKGKPLFHWGRSKAALGCGLFSRKNSRIARI